MKKKDAHNEALYLIRANRDNWQFDIARGCCELAHGIGIISDKEYERETDNIDKAEKGFSI